MITEKEFIEKIKYVPTTIPSITGKAFYTGFRIEDDTLYFHRVVPKQTGI